VGGFVKGDVVVVPFPFSDLSASKRRPAVILAAVPGDDLILSQITSKNVYDDFSVTIEAGDIENGSLAQTSNIRPNKLFTAEESLVVYRVGTLKPEKLKTATEKVIEVFMS
jgi:mRNA interferase MazF